MTDEITRRPLGPNDSSSAEGVYEYVAWPAWRYDPDTGQGQIFQAAEEVPFGWTNVPPGTTPPGEDGAIIVDESRLGVVVTEGGEAGQEGAGGAAVVQLTDNAGEGNVLLPEWTKDELVALGQAKLAELLDQKNSARKSKGEDEIEFLSNWPKAKLADAILANGGYRAAKEA